MAAALNTLLSDVTGTPAYNYSEELLPPSQIGVKTGDSFSQVYDNIVGVNYYIDAIGFGQQSMLDNKSIHPLGINYFMDTGFLCSNGAKRYKYVSTIPTGNSLGAFIQNELKAEGLPALRGLAPGMLEDAEAALNPIPLIEAAVTDTGYCECSLVTKPVGDAAGSVKSRGGTQWLTPDAYQSGIPVQTRWVGTRSLTPAEYNATPRTYNPNGTPISAANQRVDSIKKAGGVATSG